MFLLPELIDEKPYKNVINIMNWKFDTKSQLLYGIETETFAKGLMV